jgi:transglutaminase-like putative cysteine protease
MSDDLVIIVRKDPYTYSNLLRRYTLSSYNHRQGFFRHDSVDEAAHPQRLPNRPTALPVKEIEVYRVTEQEYYIVNFDPSAFIGMNMPVEIIPFETWDASSFNSAYAVTSHTSEVLPFELIDAVQVPPGPESLRLSPEEYTLYTDYGGDEAIAAFARDTVRNFTNYWDQIYAVYYRLKYSEYRYSLKPGIAPDGDQLKHFLFNSKKGYCTYYAVAFTLMLRSLGIPSRLAVGFFVDPETEAFGYYPVRADMAHAWAEVWFPGYGWIEYDPTSQVMADGEEFRFSGGTPPELFERLMKEIMDKRSSLRVKEGEDPQSERGALAALGRNTIGFFVRNWAFLSALAILFSFLSLRAGFLWLFYLHRNYRKKTLYLWAHTRRRLTLAGIKKAHAANQGEAEWAKAHNHRFDGLYALYLNAAAARFAPSYSLEDQLLMNEHYRAFNGEYARAISAGRRLLAWLIPPLALIGGRKAGVFMLLIFLFSLRPESLAQDSFPADLLFQNAMAAQDAENWERAIELLNHGITAHPLDYRFPWSLGNLYFYRRLYHLAWDEYRRAERLTPWEPALLLRLAHTAGYLNRNEASAEYLERLLVYEPDNREAIGSLAWMYFKLHRLPEGERLLLEAMEVLGDDMDFSMTLGTIYSGMFRYQEAKDSYLRAIYRAENYWDRLFAALAHYNLSILESRFYLYSQAYDRSNASLEAMNRASGRLARGELYMRRMELPRAISDYMEGYGMDSSPLSKLSLAEVYMLGGRLGEAVLYAEDCLGARDQSWMMNYGIDPVRYYRDIHEILRNSYRGLSKAEAFSCPANFKERVQSLYRRISCRFRSEVHSHLFRKYSLLAADAFAPSRGMQHLPGDIHLEALIKYCNAFEAYPRRALAYLAQARRLELPLIPGSAPSYAFEEARLKGSRKSMENMAVVITGFDPVWERDMIANAYAELAIRGNRAARSDAAERLFAINRGALLQYGLRLPVELRISGDLVNMTGTLRRAVRMAGLEISGRNSDRYTLGFALDADGLYGELYDGGRGTVVWRQNLGPAAAYQGAGWALARALRDGVFDPF